MSSRKIRKIGATEVVALQQGFMISTCGSATAEAARVSCSLGSTRSKEVVGVQDGIDDFRIFLQTSADGCRNGLPGFLAKTGLLHKPNAQAAHRAHFIRARRYLKDDAKLGAHLFLDVQQCGICGNFVDAREKFFLFGPGQLEYPNVGGRIVQEAIPVAVACAGRTFVANRKRGRHRHESGGVDHTLDKLLSGGK